MATPNPAPTREGPPRPDGIAGVVVEVSDLAATRAFYEPVFLDAQGEWREKSRSLSFCSRQQTIEFVQQTPHHTSGDGGQHQAYYVTEGRLRDLAQELSSAGHSVNWWREDHPAERAVTAYFSDPSGNRVQLLASTGKDALVAHAAIAVHDLEKAEDFYLKTLGGRIDYYHGVTVDQEIEARVWGEGKDPCAPWTRRLGRNYPGHPDPRARPRPCLQMFVGFGNSVLGVILANEHHQEPPEETLRGAPRLVLRCRQDAASAAGYLSDLAIPFEHGERSLCLRDPSGNFVQLECER